MKIVFRPTTGPQLPAKLPFEGCDYIIVGDACPGCAASVKDYAGKIQGVPGTMIRGYDTYTSDARCVGCETILGKIVVTMSTIFGLEEDERVLVHGRARVY